MEGCLDLEIARIWNAISRIASGYLHLRVLMLLALLFRHSVRSSIPQIRALYGDKAPPAARHRSEVCYRFCYPHTENSGLT